MNTEVFRSSVSVGETLLLLIQTLMSPINVHIQMFRIKEMGMYPGSMRTGASSRAGRIQINGEVLEYQKHGNQRCYFALHTRHSACTG